MGFRCPFKKKMVRTYLIATQLMFAVTTVANISITELMYHPIGGSEYEFLENQTQEAVWLLERA